MRKITQQIANAFAQGNKLTVGNTSTDGNAVILHGNYIAEKDPWGNITMTLAGYNTQTTRERLNGVAEVLGLEARFTKRGNWAYLNGRPVQNNLWYPVRGKTAC
tara:strand:+ start:277 stop:588 length:312 start_codon:yes stop_codon:yes gene_type:complete